MCKDVVFEYAQNLANNLDYATDSRALPSMGMMVAEGLYQGILNVIEPLFTNTFVVVSLFSSIIFLLLFVYYDQFANFVVN